MRGLKAGPILAALAAGLATLSACSFPVRNLGIAPDNPRYRYDTLGGVALSDTLVIVTASGGGTRATALTMAVLATMGRIDLGNGRSLADKIDIVSSVSGGSVAAAYFALYGTGGLGNLETQFVRQNGMAAMITRGIASLPALAAPGLERIDLLVDYLDRTLFANTTFQALIDRKTRPYLILNAADMVEGTPFPFTQYTLDLLCSDLSRIKLSTAVAASAAFPTALSPITLKNYRAAGNPPCPRAGETGWVDTALGGTWRDNPARVARARTAHAYMTGDKAYVHLLDGGISDNLGVAEPYRLLTGDDVSPLFKRRIAAGEIKKVVFVMINARNAAKSDLDAKPDTPGILDMLLASISSSIDRNTFSTAERLRTLLTRQWLDDANERDNAGQHATAANFRTVANNTQFVTVDFDAIPDTLAACRDRFHGIATSWSLGNDEIDGLIAMGEALLADGKPFQDLMKLVGGTPTRNFLSVAEACGTLPAKKN